MLGLLTEKMQGLLGKLAGKRKLTEENIAEAVSEVRLALLEADVNYGVAKILVKRVQAKCVGDALIKSVTPGQQFAKVVHDELVELMGGGEAELDLSHKPTVIMVCGLQGSGKTTQCIKLARYLKKKNKVNHPLVAACDLQRPAAVEQLRTLGAGAHISVFSLAGETDPIKVAKAALNHAKTNQHDLLIVDTAGRLHIDEALMQQLEKLKELLHPHQVLFVANATTGQDAVNVAAEFNKRVPVSGTILTMLDGNTRGGAAISIREVTGKPLLFEGIGEKVDDLQVFNPVSMADRILGMGDTINLVKMAEEHMDEEESKRLEKKIRSATFTYEDYLNQIQTVKKMGSIKSLLGMLPGMSNLKALDFDDKQFFKVEAMIQSMTPGERAEKCELIPGRRRRIARGSGTKTEDVDRLVKSFKQAKQFFKNMPDLKDPKMKKPSLQDIQKMMGGAPWR